MNIRRIAPVCVLLAGLCMTNAALAQNGSQSKKERQAQTQPSAKLKVGSIAPALSVKNWVKGAPISKLENGKAYVVEFWATWCPPCRKSIPHLSQVAASNKGLTVIGVASSERQGKDGDKRLEVLEQFVKEKGDEMAYTVAFDGDREMGREWMVPAGITGIPAAFLVNGEGKIAWIGNPLDEQFDGEVAKLVAAAPAPAPETPKAHGNDAIKKKK